MQPTATTTKTEPQKLNVITDNLHETDNYPYGRLRCVRVCTMEFKKGLGYRFVAQTTNPKTGRVNKPKKGTYNDYAVMYIEEGTGHVKYVAFNLRGYEDILNFQKFLQVHHDVLPEITADESADLWVIIINCIRGNVMYTEFKEDTTITEAAQSLSFSDIVQAFKEKKHIFSLTAIEYDLEAFQQHKAIR